MLPKFTKMAIIWARATRWIRWQVHCHLVSTAYSKKTILCFCPIQFIDWQSITQRDSLDNINLKWEKKVFQYTIIPTAFIPINEFLNLKIWRRTCSWGNNLICIWTRQPLITPNSNALFHHLLGWHYVLFHQRILTHLEPPPLFD